MPIINGSTVPASVKAEPTSTSMPALPVEAASAAAWAAIAPTAIGCAKLVSKRPRAARTAAATSRARAASRERARLAIAAARWRWEQEVRDGQGSVA
eukprot:CAMPEP_0115446612 /NCGR_PEP_ID=MMETSP0271-20121206/39539_1 /TAXON_ID=71861 /ORGANISM="Scrippsiella trochoidea, Strain CCMP3099" /LENGTH=96 /DNA_ID=CAMNT_0002872655 /DNA_START=38 /DNA_END=324 /DNA_ORIENTATION=-